jgi:hypothetical protein
LQASGLLGASYNSLLSDPFNPLVRPPSYPPGAIRAWPVLADYIRPNVYADAVQDSKKELPIEFLKRKYPGQSLFRFILTHPDLDHMRGLKRLHESIGFTHTKPTPDYRSDSDREDWEFYHKLRSGSVRNCTRGDSCFAFGKDENGVPGGDSIEILSPTPTLVKSCNQAGKSNDLSLVLRIRHNAWSVCSRVTRKRRPGTI